MSREQSEVLTVVTGEMDKRENKFLKWFLVGLLVSIASIAGASVILGMKIQDTLNKVNSIADAQELARTESRSRVDELRRELGEKYVSATDHDTMASMMRMGMPPIFVPFMFEIRRK
jgi:hypothetical protein